MKEHSKKGDRFREENVCVKRGKMIFRTVMHIMLVSGVWEGGYCETQNGFSKPGTHYRFNELNLKHDHCGYPELLDRDVWSCVCPMPYTKMGRECVCLGCMAEVSEEKYWKKAWDSFADFAEDELSDVSEDGKKEEQDFGGGSNNSSRRNARQVPVRRYESPRLSLGSEAVDGGRVYNNGNVDRDEVSGRGLFKPNANHLTILRVDGKSLPPKVLRPKLKPLKISNNVNEMNFLWLKKKSESNNLEEVETSSTPEPEKTSEVPSQTGIEEAPLEVSTEPFSEEPKSESGSFSDSVIFGETSGSASSGADKAFGTMSAYRGTGSMALGANNGSGAAVGFTGEGHSQVGIQSDGAEASGSVMVGPKAQKASSTMTMMAGRGDAVATNTLTDDASGSAVALATQGAASSSSAAFGAAIAGAAAAPGKGEAGGSSSYGKDTSISAKVKGRDMVSETVSVGNANDSLREALAASPSEDMENHKEASKVRQQEERTLEFFGGETEPDDWFDN